MRFDSLGFFWEEAAPVKIPKAPKPKAQPPEKVWLLPGYLPNLEEARATKYPLMAWKDLQRAALMRDPFSMDVECYPNYFLVGFRHIATGAMCVMEWRHGEEGSPSHERDLRALEWCVRNLKFITFNGIGFDAPIITLALEGFDTRQLALATKQIIVDKIFAWKVCKGFKVNLTKATKGWDHIDLKEVAPGTMVSLKIYGARFHAERLQDLPFDPKIDLNEDQICILKWYWKNDLKTTEELWDLLQEEIELREDLAKEYGLGPELRSKSDAQVAEAIYLSEIKRIDGREHIGKSKIQPGRIYKYRPPAFVKFRTKELQRVLLDLEAAEFIIGEDGYVISPPALEKRLVSINKNVYRMGIGGLHSTEKKCSHVSDDEYQLVDWDVTSYYPRVMLLLGLYPDALGPTFIPVFEKIVLGRIEDKKAKRKKKANSKKIIINGTFGKTGSPSSFLYGPDLMLQTTVTGQLCLLMLAERMEWAGIECISGNTDGIILKCRRSMDAKMREVVAGWENDTGFAMEETRYKAIYNRDINNYIAIYETPEDGKEAKTKGIFAPTGLMKNPTAPICTEAAVARLIHGTPLEATIRGCKDMTKFVAASNVGNGGGVNAATGEYLGKVARWYYSTEVEGAAIIKVDNGNKVAMTEGAKPLMLMPDGFFADDINYEFYIQRAESFLTGCGYN